MEQQNHRSSNHEKEHLADSGANTHHYPHGVFDYHWHKRHDVTDPLSAPPA